MLHATQVALSKRVLAHLDAKTTDTTAALAHNDITAFTSPDRAAREWEQLFLGRPQYLGLSCQTREAGDYLTNDDLGVPILVTRDEAGKARAFLNVCRHRGARLADGCGKSDRSFTCPYHGWTYDTSGHLIGIPDRRNFDGVEQAIYGLRELPLEERHGMLWVAPRPEIAASPSPELDGLDEELASYGFGDYHHYKTHARRWKMNWKIAIDTFLEPYHFPVLHKNTVGPVFFPNLCVVDGFGQNLREVLPRRGIVEMRQQAEADWNLVEHSAIVYVLFPNIVVVVQIDHHEIWRIYPVEGKADECMVYLEFYIPEPVITDKAVEHWRKNLDLTLRTVENEDFPAGEGIQAGLLSGAQDSIVYGRNEPALQHFEKAVGAAVGAPPLAGA
ncbi:MAG: Rieske 2Fe-2S domain-containing protein [Proteobacteria bacterium]|nr:Rieske 2Fe-2S domain-containing protein [Pseudomonadota bacterium]